MCKCRECKWICGEGGREGGRERGGRIGFGYVCAGESVTLGQAGGARSELDVDDVVLGKCVLCVCECV